MAVAVITTLLGNQGDPVEFTVDESIAVPKGTLMKISASPQTAAAMTTTNEYFAGIAAVEVKANVGTVKLALITHCIAEMTAGTGTTTVGQPQMINGANAIIDADDDTAANKAEIIGISLEDVADGDRGAVLVNL